MTCYIIEMAIYIPSTDPINCKRVYFRPNYKEPQHANVQIVPYWENHKAPTKIRIKLEFDQQEPGMLQCTDGNWQSSTSSLWEVI
jgi:hypothetical protein